MKKLATLSIGLIAVCALTACGGKGKEVKEEEFKAKAAEIEEHEYTSATVKFEYSDVTSVEGEEDQKQEGKGEIKFEKKDGEWTTDSEDEYVEVAQSYLEGNLKDLAKEDISGSISGVYAGAETSCTFYVNPFGIDYTLKGQIELLGAKMDIDQKGYMEFDKYGYMTKIEGSGTVDTTVDQEIAGVKISHKSHSVSSSKATISYK